ncbi:MAG: hypothetical protein QOE05_2948 [Actinomycetota bacterium]|jgi:hypothetical protein|nr:hypothetical protein [Actinomycetota bacterium]
MDDDVAERLDNLDLAVTQVADAVEVLATILQRTPAVRYELQSVLDQLENARRLIGTNDVDEPILE